MHADFFSIKRAYHRTTAFSARFLSTYGLTPARFDLLAAVGPYGMPQRGLRDLLGVAATTISRMVIALERLGWLARRCVPGHRRALFITLTKFGRMMFRFASKRGMRSGMVDAALKRSFLRDAPGPRRRVISVKPAMEAFRRGLDSIRGGLDDTFMRLSYEQPSKNLFGQALILYRVSVNPAWRMRTHHRPGRPRVWEITPPRCSGESPARRTGSCRRAPRSR